MNMALQQDNSLPPGIEKLMGDYERLINKQQINIRALTKSLRMFVGRERLVNHTDTCNCGWCKAVELCDEMELSQ